MYRYSIFDFLRLGKDPRTIGGLEALLNTQGTVRSARRVELAGEPEGVKAYETRTTRGGCGCLDARWREPRRSAAALHRAYDWRVDLRIKSLPVSRLPGPRLAGWIARTNLSGHFHGQFAASDCRRRRESAGSAARNSER